MKQPKRGPGGALARGVWIFHQLLEAVVFREHGAKRSLGHVG